jgi:hypothetical protein
LQWHLFISCYCVNLSCFFMLFTLTNISLVCSFYSDFPFAMNLRPFKKKIQFLLPLLFLSLTYPFQVLFFHSPVHIY